MTKLKNMENGKVLQVSWYEAASPERQELYNVEISHSHAYVLLTLLQYLRWKTRWMDYEDWNETLDYVNDIEYRLLTPIVCEDGMTEEEFKALVCAALDECLVPQLEEWYNALLAAIEAIEAKQDITNENLTTINNNISTVNSNVQNVSSTVNQISNTLNITNINNAPPTPAEKTGIEPLVETRPPAGGMTAEEFYGVCISIVEGIVQAMIDWFESLEQLSNLLELATIVGSAIPVVGDAAAAASAMVDFVQEVAMENFLAADTQARRLKFADILYCKGKDIRALTMVMIGEALAECWFGDIIDWGDPITSLASIASGELQNEQIFYMTLALGLASWTITGNFQGLITRASWRFWVNRGKNNPQSPVPDCGEDDDTLYVIVRCATNVTVGSSQAESLGGNVWRFPPPPSGTIIRITSDVPPNVSAFDYTTLSDTARFNWVTMWYYSDLRPITLPTSYSEMTNVWYVQDCYTNGSGAEHPAQSGRPTNAVAYPYNTVAPIVISFNW